MSTSNSLLPPDSLYPQNCGGPVDEGMKKQTLRNNSLRTASDRRPRGSFAIACAVVVLPQSKKCAIASKVTHFGIIFLLFEFVISLPQSIGQEVASNRVVINNLSSKTPLDIRIISESKVAPGLLQPDGLWVVTERVPVSGKVAIQIPNGEYTLVAGVLTDDNTSLSLTMPQQMDFGPKGIEVKSTLHFFHTMVKKSYQVTGNGNATLINRSDGTPLGITSYQEISEGLIFSFTQNATEWTYRRISSAGLREFVNNAGKKLVGKVIAVSNNKENSQIQLESGEVRLIKTGTLSLNDQNYLKTLPPTEIAKDQYVAIERTDGRTINAQFIAAKEDSLQIRLADGRSFEIPLSQLTPACAETFLGSRTAGQTPPSTLAPAGPGR